MYGINDVEIKNLVLEYQEQGAGPLPEAVQRTLSLIIMDYPRRLFFRNADDCSDFYEYVCCRLPRILKTYTQTNALFTTWFLVVLRNHYLNWLKSAEDKERTVSLTPRPGREISPGDRVSFNLWREEQQPGADYSTAGQSSFRKWFKVQKPERKLLLTLLFGECDPGNLQALTGNAGRAAALYGEYLSFSRRSCLKRERLLSRLAACQSAVVRLEKSLFWTDRSIPEPDERLRETARIGAKLKTWKGRLAKWLRRLNRMKYNMPYGWVGRITGWSVDRIKRQLALIRKDLGEIPGLEVKK